MAKEVLSEPTEKGTIEEDDRIYEASERLDNIMQWATVFRDRIVEITDFEDDEYTC